MKTFMRLYVLPALIVISVVAFAGLVGAVLHDHLWVKTPTSTIGNGPVERAGVYPVIEKETPVVAYEVALTAEELASAPDTFHGYPLGYCVVVVDPRAGRLISCHYEGLRISRWGHDKEWTFYSMAQGVTHSPK